MIFLPVCLAALALSVAAFTPRSSAIEGSLLKVRSSLFTFRFDLSSSLEIQEVRRVIWRSGRRFACVGLGGL